MQVQSLSWDDPLEEGMATHSRQEHWSGCHFLLQYMKVKSESELTTVVPDSSQPHGLQPTKLLCPWESPG